MPRKLRVKTLVILLICVCLVVTPVIAYAQSEDSTPAQSVTDQAVETNEEGPAGVGLLILLVGLALVAWVGIVMIDRDVYKEDGGEAV